MKPGPQHIENFDDFGEKIPHPGLGKVTVNAFEKRVAIQLAGRGRNLINDLVYQLTPPAFVIVLARTVDGRTDRHSLPAISKRSIERICLQAQTDAFADKSIMMPDAPRQITQRPGRVEENCGNGVLAFHLDPDCI